MFQLPNNKYFNPIDCLMANIAVALRKEQRGCSDPQVKKILGVKSDVLWDVGRGVRILTKKLIT
jgi:hypothetical protein